MTYTFPARLWEYEGEAPWVFVTLPRHESDEIADSVEWRPGFGSVKVTVRIGDTEWSTSLFPSKELGAYVLPIKRAVRDREMIDVGDEVAVTISIEG